MANLHSKASVGNLMMVHKKYSHVKLMGVAKFPHVASLCSAHSRTLFEIFFIFLFMSFIYMANYCCKLLSALLDLEFVLAQKGCE
jgi:hypothetical protein